MALPRFGYVALHRQPLADGVAAEARWLADCAASGRPAARLWQGATGWVVPRRLTALPGWPAAAAAHAGLVQVRASGGGLVPQGPGVWNLSLVWPAPSAEPSGTDAVYTDLCRQLALALARVGVQAQPQPVEGSFCDGRFNLAVNGRKLVGTAQAWRRVAGRPVVLAHAVLVLGADPVALTEQANTFEAALGRGRPYRPECLTSVALETPEPANIEARTLQALAEQFARAIPPHEHKETNDGDA